MISCCETHFLVKEVHTGKEGPLVQLSSQISVCFGRIAYVLFALHQAMGRVASLQQDQSY